MERKATSYWAIVWQQYKRNYVGVLALAVVLLFTLVGLYAPFLASSKPILVIYDGDVYFPLFRYLFFRGFFTKRIDLFYNLLMFFFPLALWIHFRARRKVLWVTCSILSFALLFLWVAFGPTNDPASDPVLNEKRQAVIQAKRPQQGEDALLGELPQSMTFTEDLSFQPTYRRLNRVLRYQQRLEQHQNFQVYHADFEEDERRKWLLDAVRERRKEYLRQGISVESLPAREALVQEVLAERKPGESFGELPTLWQVKEENVAKKQTRLKGVLKENEEAYRQARQNYQELRSAYLSGEGDVDALRRARDTITRFEEAQSQLQYQEDLSKWLTEESEKVSLAIYPLLRRFHWEDDAGGEQSLNQYVDWWHLTRINRKDLVAGLIFGIRISLMVGVTAVLLSLVIGIPVGSAAGYYGGKFDILIFRLIEIWESMPVFFMLLMVVAITQSKSIFLVVAVLGIFGWTGFSRYIRGEFLKQRHLPYVDACRAMGFGDSRIIFGHVLPNAIPPLLTLLPFAVLGAITSEAGLSFLGLGEEGSCSWGVLMDEGRTAFPGESYLLWPPAILLTLLLVSIALVGDALRDALDPKMRH